MEMLNILFTDWKTGKEQNTNIAGNNNAPFGLLTAIVSRNLIFLIFILFKKNTKMYPPYPCICVRPIIMHVSVGIKCKSVFCLMTFYCFFILSMLLCLPFFLFLLALSWI
jgi:hypothetical protein